MNKHLALWAAVSLAGWGCESSTTTAPTGNPSRGIDNGGIGGPTPAPTTVPTPTLPPITDPGGGGGGGGGTQTLMTNIAATSLGGTCWVKCTSGGTHTTPTGEKIPYSKLKYKWFDADGTYARVDYYFYGADCADTSMGNMYKRKQYCGTYTLGGTSPATLAADNGMTYTVSDATNIDMSITTYYRTYYQTAMGGDEAVGEHCSLTGWQAGMPRNLASSQNSPLTPCVGVDTSAGNAMCTATTPGSECEDTGTSTGNNGVCTNDCYRKDIFEIIYMPSDMGDMYLGHTTRAIENNGHNAGARPNSFGSHYLPCTQSPFAMPPTNATDRQCTGT